MKKYHKVTPEGTRDLLFEECGALREVGCIATDIFQSRGYHEVITPTIEYYDVFQKGDAGILQETAYKLVDAQGRILVLRPDSTSPIARFTATRLQGAGRPIRLCYTQNVFRMNKGLSGHSNEIIQSGVELIGGSGLLFDLEVLCLAVETLGKTCPKEFRIELGHAGIFRDLVNTLRIDEEQKEELRFYVETKNTGALCELLEQFEDTLAIRVLRELPRLFGGEEIFAKAEAFACEQLGDSLAYLKRVHKALSNLFPAISFQIDFGLVHRNEYYTGLVFRGYIQGSGVAVLSGGRYDSLLEKFGLSLPAIGFALDNDAIAKSALSAAHMKDAPADCLVAGLPGQEEKAMQIYQEQLSEGRSCELFCCGDGLAAKEYALGAGIPHVIVVGASVERYKLDAEGKGTHGTD